jgi:hypothetical protein
VFPMRYELGFHISEDDILHSHRRENLKSYIASYNHSWRKLIYTYKYTQRYQICFMTSEPLPPRTNSYCICLASLSLPGRAEWLPAASVQVSLAHQMSVIPVRY